MGAAGRQATILPMSGASSLKRFVSPAFSAADICSTVSVSVNRTRSSTVASSNVVNASSSSRNASSVCLYLAMERPSGISVISRRASDSFVMTPMPQESSGRFRRPRRTMLSIRPLKPRVQGLNKCPSSEPAAGNFGIAGNVETANVESTVAVIP